MRVRVIVILLMFGGSIIVSGCTPLIEASHEVSAALDCSHVAKLSRGPIGFINASENFAAVSQLGVYFDMEYPGPFVWESIQPGRSTPFDFSESDQVVQRAQAHGFSLLGILWPYASWDQDTYGLGRECVGGGLTTSLPAKRCIPDDMEAYSKYVTDVVERYDGDGLYDVEGLCEPIRHWQVIASPSQQAALGDVGTFKGQAIDYFNLLRVTFNAVKGSCPRCDVHYGALAGDKDEAYTFLEEVLTLGGAEYFDAVSIHATGEGVADSLVRVQEILNAFYHPKPLWVTRIIPDESLSLEAGVIRGFVEALAGGAEKALYPQLTSDIQLVPSQNAHALLRPDGEPREAFWAFQTFVKKISNLSSVQKIAPGQFKFSRDGDVSLYVLWKSGDEAMPDVLTGELRITSLNGTMEVRNISDVTLSEEPIYVE